jgi:hypothetical protein
VGTAHPGCLDSIIYCLALAGRPVLGQQALRLLDPDLGQVLGEGDAEVAAKVIRKIRGVHGEPPGDRAQAELGR